MSKRKEDLGGEVVIDLMTMDEAAHYLRVTLDTLRAWKKRKLLAYYKIGGRYMFKKKDIDSFVEGCRVEACKR